MNSNEEVWVLLSNGGTIVEENYYTSKKEAEERANHFKKICLESGYAQYNFTMNATLLRAPDSAGHSHTETPLVTGWESDQCPECKDILGHKSSCARQFDNDEDF